MASELSPEAKELALVGKVEMRIALASSEKKLEDLLRVYLAPLLLKLGSDSVAVRNKVGCAPMLHSYCALPAALLLLKAANRGFSLGHIHLPAYQHTNQVTVRFLYTRL